MAPETTSLPPRYPGPSDESIERLLSAFDEERPVEAVAAFLESCPSTSSLLAGTTALLRSDPYSRAVDSARRAVHRLVDRDAIHALEPRVAYGIFGAAGQPAMAKWLIHEEKWIMDDRLYPKTGETQYWRIHACVGSHLFDDAHRLLDQHRISPVWTRLLRGEAFVKEKRYPEAMDVLRPIADLGNEARYLYSRAAVMAGEGDPRELIDLLAHLPRTHARRFILEGRLARHHRRWDKSVAARAQYVRWGLINYVAYKPLRTALDTIEASTDFGESEHSERGSGP